MKTKILVLFVVMLSLFSIATFADNDTVNETIDDDNLTIEVNDTIESMLVIRF